MEKEIAAAEADRDFSRVLREVQAGDTYTVMSDGRPVARIVPVEIDDPEQRKRAWRELLDRLKSQPALNLGPWTREELYER